VVDTFGCDMPVNTATSPDETRECSSSHSLATRRTVSVDPCLNQRRSLDLGRVPNFPFIASLAITELSIHVSPWCFSKGSPLT
jgi:hypothetical protein